MNLPKKNLLVVILFFFLITHFPSSTFAAYGMYNSPETCSLTVDKKVANPAVIKKVEYIDNISSTGEKYRPNQAILMKMTIKNISNEVAVDVKIIDEIPQYLSYVAGPVELGNGGSSFTIRVGNLNPQEAKSFIITFKAASEDKLPANQSIFCFTNRIYTQSLSCTGSEDTAQICIERMFQGTTKGGLALNNIKQTPNSGPEFGLALLAVQALIGGAGYLIKKKSSI